jgi:hypothetical protein
VAQPSQFTISGIYYFGCDGSFVNEIKVALPIHVGDKHVSEDQKSIKSKVGNAVWQTIRCFPTNVAIINCGKDTWNVYIGLPGRSVSTPTYNPPPKEDQELPKEATELYEDMMQTLAEVLSTKGGVIEDDSKGYALSADPQLREKELKFRQWSLQHESTVKKILTSSAVSSQRAIAAEALGYLDPSIEQTDILIEACRDEGSGVRNNATRALACIAKSNKTLAARMPAAPFVQMLNSGIWTDRNKGEFVLMRLCDQNPALLQTNRNQIFQALAEMSCWDEPHARGAQSLLKRACGLTDDRLKPLFMAGDVDAIVKLAKGKDADDKAPLAPSLPELGVILKEVFLADQSDIGRSKAPECYKTLLALRSKFAGTKLEPDYFNALSLECFHMGQHKAFADRDVPKALEQLKYSLNYAQECRHAWVGRNEKYMEQGADEWSDYVQATITYLEGDVSRLEALQNKCGANQKTAARLFGGLKKFGTPDYSRDY